MCSSAPSQGSGYIPRVALLAQQKAAVRNAEREAERQVRTQAENHRPGAASSLNRRQSHPGNVTTARKELGPVRDRANYGQ